MRYLFLILLLASNLASAELYRCEKGGRVAYQDSPCDRSAAAKKVMTDSDPMPGCYSVKFLSGSNEAFQIRADGGGRYELLAIDPKTPGGSPNMLPMNWKRATPEILKTAGLAWRNDRGGPEYEGFDFDLKDGIAIAWEKNAENQKPMGIFRGKGQGNKDMYLFAFVIGTGIGTRTPCP